MNLPNNVSEAVKRRNPNLYPAYAPVAELDRSIGEQNTKPALVKDAQAKQTVRGGVKVCVTIIACRKRLLDSDNLVASFKHLRDLIARHIQVDDADPRVVWEYGQIQGTRSGTIVKIEVIT